MPPKDSEGKKYRFGIRINGKDHEYESFEEMFSDFVDEMVAKEKEAEDECTDCLDAMAAEFFATYKAFIKAGFNPEQAFELLLTIVGKED